MCRRRAHKKLNIEIFIYINELGSQVKSLLNSRRTTFRWGTRWRVFLMEARLRHYYFRKQIPD